MQKSLEGQEYELEISKIAAAIKKQKAKKVLIQLPDGLKPYAVEIVNALKKQTEAEIFIWSASCFGACDLPLEVENLGIDMIVQFGHSKWGHKRKNLTILR